MKAKLKCMHCVEEGMGNKINQDKANIIQENGEPLILPEFETP